MTFSREAALESYRSGMAIAEKLAESDPSNTGWQRDLSVSHNKTGDVQQAQGDLEAALESYRSDMAIAEKLAESDPSNAGWQRDLSVSHERIGDVQRGRETWRRRKLPVGHGDCREIGGVRPQQCRVAARPFRFAQQDW